MSMYQQMICQALVAAGRLDRADGATAAVVEEMMRTNRTSLSHLTRQEITREAVELVAEMDHAPDDVRFFAETFRLDVPAWAR